METENMQQRKGEWKAPEMTKYDLDQLLTEIVANASSCGGCGGVSGCSWCACYNNYGVGL